MTALLGKVLLLTGCTAWGLLAGSRLGERAACLEEFRQALAALSRELSFSLRPLWELMTQAAAGSRGPAAAFFQVCCARFAQGGRESWAESWQQALAEVPLPLTLADRRLLEEGRAGAGPVRRRESASGPGGSAGPLGGPAGGSPPGGQAAVSGLWGPGDHRGPVLSDPAVKFWHSRLGGRIE